MRVPYIRAFCATVVIGTLVACASHAHDAYVLPTAEGMQRIAQSIHRETATELLMHSFGPGERKGQFPSSSLINVNGILFGVAGGGTRQSGTIFSLTPQHQYHVLYNFKGTSGGAGPSGLVDVNGTLYGTAGAGINTAGIVYKLTPQHGFKVLYRFKGTPDGAGPTEGLVDVNGTLYGTTSGGGVNNYGTVYSITPSGRETVLYSFLGWANGMYPNGSLLDVNGMLYGTAGGGTGGDNHAGIVFAITTSGQYSLLYSFAGGGAGDGYYPNGGLINHHGVLYGTTFYGGKGGGPACTNDYYHLGCGTVYRITTSGAEKVLYSFAGPPDGTRPRAGLTEISGIMYGTTTEGGAACLTGDDAGCGTVFSIDRQGKETVLHSFTGTRGSSSQSADGSAPLAALLAVNGTLYGTTIAGGMYDGCQPYGSCGTIFEITTNSHHATAMRLAP
jgi:uncharacterized repeat protein (TIGR03803 family)